jgi:hypothetical protein
VQRAARSLVSPLLVEGGRFRFRVRIYIHDRAEPRTSPIVSGNFRKIEFDEFFGCAGPPAARNAYRRVNSRGRGRLPVWVVRILDVLRCMGSSRHSASARHRMTGRPRPALATICLKG